MKKIVFMLLMSMFCTMYLGCVSSTYSVQVPISVQSEYTEQINGLERIPEPEEPTIESKVSFLAVGDNIIYNGQLREGLKNASNDPSYDGKYDFRPMYKNVADIIASADISFVNQETVMSTRYEPSQYPSFNSPQELGENLVEVGFDVVNIATNHMLDKWYDGLEDTIDFWEDQDVLMIGGYRHKDDFMNIRYIERNDIKIALVGFTYHPSDREDKPLFIPQIDDDLIIEWLTKAEQEADLTIVSLHWGEEYTQTPNKEQRRLAQLIADYGGDVILGHHTHCLQPIEWVEGKEGNKTLCFYSLGNFTSETDETVSLPGGIAQLDIIKSNKTGIRIENITFTPTVMDYRNSFNTNIVYLLKDYTEELCKSHNIVTYFKQNLDLKLLRNYVSTAIDEKYLVKSYLDSLS